MTTDQTVALARCLNANVRKAEAHAELDAAIAHALRRGLSTRTIARYAGVGFATVARRQRQLNGQPERITTP